jgi:hypothetical protein
VKNSRTGNIVSFVLRCTLDGVVLVDDKPKGMQKIAKNFAAALERAELSDGGMQKGARAAIDGTKLCAGATRCLYKQPLLQYVI